MKLKTLFGINLESLCIVRAGDKPSHAQSVFVGNFETPNMFLKLCSRLISSQVIILMIKNFVLQVVIPVEPLSIFDPLGNSEDHEACWQMQYRGSLGETLIHLLIICDTQMHTRLARIFLRAYPKLAVDVVEGEEYLGI
jgi:hypothetical protein